MTQNTRTTTAERIFALIFENIGYTDGDDRTVAAIAAEIDALTAERDEARDKLIEVRDTLHHTNNEFAVILRERNEARAEVKAGDAGNKLVRSEQEAQRLTRMRDFERDAAGTMADQYSILAEERNALKADVERLRPAAEAWEAQEVYDSLTGYEPNLPDIWQKRQAAAARARAAKGEK